MKAAIWMGPFLSSRLPLLVITPLAITLVFIAAVGGAGVHANRLVTVDYVIDGDTVILDNGEKVRLIGINAPEMATDYAPAQPFAREARHALVDLVEKRRVELVVGSDARDRYGRTLAYLRLLDGTDIQQTLLREGYAMLVAFPPNLKHINAYAQAESQARRQRRRVWGDPFFAVRWLPSSRPIPRGFGRIGGRVTAVSSTRKTIRMVLGGSVVLLIPRDAWQTFWAGDAADLRGQRLIAQGWVGSRKGAAGLEQWMWIRHPLMLKHD